MKQKLLAFCAAAIFIAACNNEKKETTSADKKMDGTETKKQTLTMPDSATSMKNWEAYMTPGDVHKMMASWDGSWNGDVSMTMVPGAPEEKSKSTAINKMVMGGRYQVSNHSGNMMGMPFEGMSITSYDNAKKVFTSIWIDNMGTGVMKMEGPWDEATKTMTLKGKMVEPGAGDGREVDVKETFKIVDNDHQVMEMFGIGPDGKEFKSMHIDYTRKK